MSEQSTFAAAVASAASAVAPKATWAGAGGAAAGWALSSEALGLAGVLVAVIGAAVNWYFKAQEARITRRRQLAADARAEELHALRKELLRAGIPVEIDTGSVELDG